MLLKDIQPAKRSEAETEQGAIRLFNNDKRVLFIGQGLLTNRRENASSCNDIFFFLFYVEPPP